MLDFKAGWTSAVKLPDRISLTVFIFWSPSRNVRVNFIAGFEPNYTVYHRYLAPNIVYFLLKHTSTYLIFIFFVYLVGINLIKV